MYQPHLVTFKKNLWVVCLAASLMFTQGTLLHTHVYDHHPSMSEHAHVDQTHFANDDHEAHRDKFVEIDLTNQGLPRNFSFGLLVIALFTAVIALTLPRLYTRVSRLRDNHVLRFHWRESLLPPLRAPPL